MADCSAFGCDGDDGLAFSCNECGQRFCAAHRLPENHRCPALLKKTDDDRKHFQTGLSDRPGNIETSKTWAQMSPRKRQVEAQRRRRKQENDEESRRFEDVKDEALEEEKTFRAEHLDDETDDANNNHETEETSNDVSLEAGDSLFGDESSSRPWHRTQSSDDVEDLSPRERMMRPENRKQNQNQESEENRGFLSRLRSWLLG